MIDSTKSPIPVWRKYLIVVVLGALIVVAGYLVWTKELHKSSANNPSSTPTTVTVPAKVIPTKAPDTTVPGGVPISNRNPFGG